MKLFFRRQFWFIFLLLSTTVVLGMFLKLHFRPPQGLPLLGKVENFELMERSGKKISLSDLKGKIWIADFIFTRCAGICPMMSAKMRRIQDLIKNNPQIRLVSFSVDPDHDTPEILSAYAKQFDADPEKWFFLTGDKEKIFELSQQHMHLGVNEIPIEEQSSPFQSVNHSSRFVLIDGEANIRGYYASEDQDFLTALKNDIKQLQR